MRRILALQSTSLLIVMLGLAGAVPTISRSQTTASPAAPPTTPPRHTPDPNSSAQKRSEMGVWHHFGKDLSTPAAAPAQAGAWRRFGEQSNAPILPRNGSPVRSLALSRTQRMEQLLYELVNRDRADPANLPETRGRALTLRWNERLAAVARAHSLDMLNQGYFAHQDPQGKNVAGRVEAAGMVWQALGENIAISASVAGAEGAFMNEPRFAKNHRANILSANFTDIGIGIVQGADGRLYITQDFYAAPTPAESR